MKKIENLNKFILSNTEKFEVLGGREVSTSKSTKLLTNTTDLSDYTVVVTDDAGQSSNNQLS
jgi:hypothetical protein